MNKKDLKLLIMMMFTVIVSSCEKTSLSDVNISNDSFYTKNGQSVLGKRIDDPYNINNMQEALANLIENESDVPLTTLEPTGVYVRVLVDKLEEIDCLHADSTIIWFNYPLDYELIGDGCSFQASELHGSNKTWQYAVLPVGYQLPAEFSVDTIYSVFIPDEHPLYNEKKQLFDGLEQESFRICGFNMTKANSWTPSAHITVYDNFKGTIPLQGVRVNAHNTTKTSYAITDANGNCTMPTTFNYSVTYSIDWSRNNWKIVDDDNNTVYLTGPSNMYSQWNKNIGLSDGAQLMRATIHRAALIANYGSNWTIQRPHASSSLSTYYKLKIRYKHSGTIDNKLGISGCIPGSIDLEGADIIIYGKYSSGDLRTTQDIFAGTIHELGHWSHYILGFGNSNLFIKEGWASCIAWKIATDHYQGYYPATGYNNGFQDWISPQTNNYDYYTPVFIDLIDNYNQHTYNSACCNDNVSGFSLAEIETYIISKNITNRQSLYLWFYARASAHGVTPVEMAQILDFYSPYPF